MRFAVTLLVMFLFQACQQQSGSHEEKHSHNHSTEKHDHHHGGHDHNKSNHLMNKQSFEDLVDAFESKDREDYQQPTEVLERLSPLKGKKIMDIGAGTGYFAFRMVEKGAKVIAADVDDRFLNYLKEKRKKLGLKKEDLEVRKVPYDSPALKESEVDAVLIVNTYHHIENRTAYFKEVMNGLKPGGKLMIVDFKKEQTPHGPPPDHRISVAQVEKEMLSAGDLEISIDHKTLPEQYIITIHK